MAFPGGKLHCAQLSYLRIWCLCGFEAFFCIFWPLWEINLLTKNDIQESNLYFGHFFLDLWQHTWRPTWCRDWRQKIVSGGHIGARASWWGVVPNPQKIYRKMIRIFRVLLLVLTKKKWNDITLSFRLSFSYRFILSKKATFRLSYRNDGLADTYTWRCSQNFI